MVAYELGIDNDIVRTWSVRKIKGWMTFLELRNDLEKEAMDRAQTKLDLKAGKGNTVSW